MTLTSWTYSLILICNWPILGEFLGNQHRNFFQLLLCHSLTGVLVNDLIAKDPNAIKKLITQKPRIDKLEPSDFDVLDFELDTDVKGKLTSPF